MKDKCMGGESVTLYMRAVSEISSTSFSVESSNVTDPSETSVASCLSSTSLCFKKKNKYRTSLSFFETVHVYYI